MHVIVILIKSVIEGQKEKKKNTLVCILSPSYFKNIFELILGIWILLPKTWYQPAHFSQ